MNKWEKLRDTLTGWAEGANAGGFYDQLDAIEKVLNEMNELEKTE
ncbi:hypothetical protein [Brevibacillus brevis]|nr:hypothetical protein [Brevibacillus brevis]